MLSQRLIFEIHRLSYEGFSLRKIAALLGLSRQVVTKYLRDPAPPKALRPRPSKLDPFRSQIGQFLEIDPAVSGQVILQRLRALGFAGGYTILKDYLRTVRAPRKKAAFIRFESAPGEQCQVDWGHFGAIPYGNTARKLYCLGVIESHSRMLYLEFTHSQGQQALHRGLLNAFRFFGGSPKKLVHDNMKSAVIEREGPLTRFNDAFLAFLRPFKVVPVACNPGQAHEKGKVEKGAMHYIRYNFLPLRSFTNLDDLQAQANQWRDETANTRIHSTTGERPCDRLRKEAMIPLPEFLPDCRDAAQLRVYDDFAVHFDGNWYTVPPWAVGRKVSVKADNRTVTVYFKDRPIATHKRSWMRKQRLEMPEHREAAAAVGLVELLEPLVVRREPALRGDVDDERDLAGEVDGDRHEIPPSPIALAIRSRCHAGVPSHASIERARLRWRCTSYSQVKPTPPWIWSASAAQRK